MTWSAGIDRTTGALISASDWNKYLGVGGSLMETAPAKVTTAGDLVYGSAANALSRLGIGSNGQVLTVSGGLPAWVTSADRAWLYRTSNQTISNNTDTDISWTTAASPTSSGWWAVGNPTQLTVPRTGALVILGRVLWTGNATGVRKLQIRRNDGTVFAETEIPVPNASQFTELGFAVAAESPGTYFTLRVNQNSGGNLDAIGGQFYQTALMAFMLAGS